MDQKFPIWPPGRDIFFKSQICDADQVEGGFVYIQPSVWFGISSSWIDLVSTCPEGAHFAYDLPTVTSDQWKWKLGLKKNSD